LLRCLERLTWQLHDVGSSLYYAYGIYTGCTALRRLFSDRQMHDLELTLNSYFTLNSGLFEIIHVSLSLTVGRSWGRGLPVYIASCA